MFDGYVSRPCPMTDPNQSEEAIFNDAIARLTAEAETARANEASLREKLEGRMKIVEARARRKRTNLRGDQRRLRHRDVLSVEPVMAWKSARLSSTCSSAA